MEERILELTIFSAQDLKKVSTFGHDTCYAVAYIYSTEKKVTGVAKNGGENPKWNTKLTFTCDGKLLHRAGSYIIVDIYHCGTFSNKLVGTSKISLIDVGKSAGSTHPQFVAFEVRRPSGKVKGVLNVSTKVGEKRMVYNSRQAFGAYSGQQGGSPLGYLQTSLVTSWSAQAPAIYPPPNLTVYSPPRTGSDSRVAVAGAPPRASSDSSATSSNISKTEEPVMAYPATGYLGAFQYGQQYGPQHDDSRFAGYQQNYYPLAQGSYGYQNVQYSKPSNWRGRSSSSGAGMGLLGGLLGGLLLGDVIGDIF